MKQNNFSFKAFRWSLPVFLALGNVTARAEVPTSAKIVARPDLFQALTEPPCSYCSTQHRKGLIRDNDPVLAWLRGAHNGGAFPLRHFLSGTRVLNDTYGLFFYDPDGGYVAAYQKDYGYRFHGWLNGVMIVSDRDGSLWSALSGRCLAGPSQGKRLKRIPSMTTHWSYWLMLHPESTAYDLFDGERYAVVDLPTVVSDEARKAMQSADSRLKPTALVLGVDAGDTPKAYPLDETLQRDCFIDTVAGVPIAVFWYQPTRSAVAFRREVRGMTLTFHADEISPESAPIKDRETGTRWTLAGRAIDGPLRGAELEWVDSIQARWFAWSAEYPNTAIYSK
jgi:hypothetical protein